MEIIKAIINLITSWFQKSTVETKKEVKLADAETKAVIETIRANENAKAVKQQERVQEAIKEVHTKYEEEGRKQQDMSIDDQLDDQFGRD